MSEPGRSASAAKTITISCSLPLSACSHCSSLSRERADRVAVAERHEEKRQPARHALRSLFAVEQVLRVERQHRGERFA